jgi:hypothetical protein
VERSSPGARQLPIPDRAPEEPPPPHLPAVGGGFLVRPEAVRNSRPGRGNGGKRGQDDRPVCLLPPRPALTTTSYVRCPVDGHWPGRTSVLEGWPVPVTSSASLSRFLEKSVGPWSRHCATCIASVVSSRHSARVPSIEIRVRDWGIPCPRCEALLQLREFALRSSGEPDKEPRWLVAQRFCASGCVLLASDLDSLYERGPEDT